MYDCSIKTEAIKDLEDKVVNIADVALTLAQQGYIINKRKFIKLDFSSIMIHAFENIDIFEEDQQSSIERLYNKLSIL